MTRRGGREASEGRGIGDDGRQPVMARLAARSRRSNISFVTNECFARYKYQSKKL